MTQPLQGKTDSCICSLAPSVHGRSSFASGSCSLTLRMRAHKLITFFFLFCFFKFCFYIGDSSAVLERRSKVPAFEAVVLTIKSTNVYFFLSSQWLKGFPCLSILCPAGMVSQKDAATISILSAFPIFQIRAKREQRSGSSAWAGITAVGCVSFPFLMLWRK